MMNEEVQARTREYTQMLDEQVNLREIMFSTKGTGEYADVLARTQQYIARHLTGDVSQMSASDIRGAILNYVTDQGVTCSLTDEPRVLTDHLYHDMSELSFITRENLFELEGFEELDINAWNDVDMIVAGRRRKTEYSFLSAKHGMDIMRRIMQKTGATFDDAMPYVITDMGAGLRIAALKYPIVDEERGIACSIRKVSGTTITRDQLLDFMVDEKMLNLLLLLIRHGVSLCFSGETGSGKTTLAGYILKEVAKTLRTFTIEEGSREWDFLDYGEDGKVRNSVVHCKTRPSDDPKRNIDQNKALQIALRFNPTLVGVGEMRSDEAYSAAEASTTGHTVATTVHANSATDAPFRIVGLCKKAYDFSDDTLQMLVANAFPIQVFQEFLADGTRRVTEIVEVLGVENGKFQFNTLCEFIVQDNETDEETGELRVIGGYVWHNPVSGKLGQKLLKKGATRNQLLPYIEKQEVQTC